MLSLHMWIITSIRYSAGLSSGPGPIRNCISSPWGKIIQDSRRVWLLMGVNRTLKIYQGRRSRWWTANTSHIFLPSIKNIETKMKKCYTCLTPLQTGHPSLLACHPNSYLDIHEEISKSVPQRSKVVLISQTYLNTGPDVRPVISSWLQVYRASPTIFSRLKNLLEAFCSPLKLHSE